MLWKGSVQLLKQIIPHLSSKAEQVPHIIGEGSAAVVG